jgi:MFS family permease
MSTSLVHACFFSAANGIGLALVIPCAQSLMADLYPSEQRGRAFGAMQLTMSFGSMLGSLFATNVAGIRVRPLWPQGTEHGAAGKIAISALWHLVTCRSIAHH